MRFSISLERCREELVPLLAPPAWQLPAFRSEFIRRGSGFGGRSGTWELSEKPARRNKCITSVKRCGNFAWNKAEMTSGG